MNKILTLFIFSVVTVSFSSCATIFSGSRQTVKIQSVPPGADIYVEGEKVGKTPADVELKRGFSPESVVLKKEGFENKEVSMHTTLNPVAIINLGSLLGWGIDAATGAMMKYEKKFYEVTLDSKPVSANK